MTNITPTIELLTERAKIAAGRAQTIDVLLRITPPDVERTANIRPRLNLSLVLDRSGSMDGRKMSEAKEAAKYCIENLSADDRLSTVVFDDVIDVLIPSQLVKNKEGLKSTIDTVHSHGSTALHEAWVTGGLQVTEHADDEAVNRVLLITDGQANRGETNVDRIVSQARELTDKGISTSTIGIGGDFNEDLLVPMAEAGGGNAWHVQEPDDMRRIFETELQGLMLLVGRDARLEISPNGGVVVTDVLNDLVSDGPNRYRLPNLQAGSTLDIVVRLKIDARPAGEKADLVHFAMHYVDAETQAAKTLRAQLIVDLVPEAEAERQQADNRVLQAVQLLMNARARREAIAGMDRHDPAAAQAAIQFAVSGTRARHAEAASPALAKELLDLESLDMMIQQDSVMARKMGRYQSHSRRTGKQRP